MIPSELDTYIGRPFVRVSPLTGGQAKGIVKWIGVHSRFGFKEPGLEALVQFNIQVTSTNGVSYDLSECHFESAAVARYNALKEQEQPFQFVPITSLKP